MQRDQTTDCCQGGSDCWCWGPSPKLIQMGRIGTWPCPCGRNDPHYHEGEHVVAGRWPWQAPGSAV